MRAAIGYTFTFTQTLCGVGMNSNRKIHENRDRMGKWSKGDDPFEVFYKGAFMGIAEAIPGVSGGTIALIAGIYEELISAIRSIDFRFMVHLPLAVLDRKYLERAKGAFLSIHFFFILPLIAGMALGFLSTISLIVPALSYPIYLYSFFFGLILASAVGILDRVGEINPRTFLACLTGFLLAFLLAGFEEMALSHTIPIIFLAGFLAVFAMILPGISGAFVVLLMGQYEYMIKALFSIQSHWAEAGAFLIGAVISLFLIVRPLSYLLREYHAHTLFFLTGLMLGALRLPFGKVVLAVRDPLTLFGAIVFGAIGLLIIALIERERRKWFYPTLGKSQKITRFLEI